MRKSYSREFKLNAARVRDAAVGNFNLGFSTKMKGGLLQIPLS
jgi:hypothetical protein